MIDRLPWLLIGSHHHCSELVIFHSKNSFSKLKFKTDSFNIYDNENFNVINIFIFFWKVDVKIIWNFLLIFFQDECKLKIQEESKFCKNLFKIRSRKFYINRKGEKSCKCLCVSAVCKYCKKYGLASTLCTVRRICIAMLIGIFCIHNLSVTGKLNLGTNRNTKGKVANSLIF